MVQPDVKRLVAYSSVSHMGFVVLGLFSFTELGMQGALYQMLNHGVSTGALFLFVGMIYERRHTRMISDFGGLATSMPWFSALFVIASLSSIGLAASERLCRRVSDHDRDVDFNGRDLALDCDDARRRRASSGLPSICSGCCSAWSSGASQNPENARLKDLNAREVGLLIPLLILMLLMGVFPRPFLDRSRQSVVEVRNRVVRPQSGGTIAGDERKSAINHE